MRSGYPGGWIPKCKSASHIAGAAHVYSFHSNLKRLSCYNSVQHKLSMSAAQSDAFGNAYKAPLSHD